MLVSLVSEFCVLLGEAVGLLLELVPRLRVNEFECAILRNDIEYGVEDSAVDPRIGDEDLAFRSRKGRAQKLVEGVGGLSAKNSKRSGCVRWLTALSPE